MSKKKKADIPEEEAEISVNPQRAQDYLDALKQHELYADYAKNSRNSFLAFMQSKDIFSVDESNGRIQVSFRHLVDDWGNPKSANVNTKSIVRVLNNFLRAGMINFLKKEFENNEGEVIKYWTCTTSPGFDFEFLEKMPDDKKLEHNFRLLMIAEYLKEAGTNFQINGKEEGVTLDHFAFVDLDV